MKTTQPSNYIESKIKLLLCINGYKQRDIEFSCTNDNQKDRFLRVGYWGFIDNDIIALIQDNTKTNLTPNSFWDDDCGWKTSYKIKYTGGNNG
tara:strand:- start:50 stop:328 length:279 start_codon:yes stop_codon:yes gene_type:complete